MRISRIVPSLIRPLANSLWYLLSLPESLAFHRARRDVAATQETLLLRLLRANAQTEFGRRYNFAGIRSAAGYQASVPLSTYDDYETLIQRIGAGQSGVLTHDPVLLFEPTSGSTAATKMIPYTAGLKAEFQRAIAPWIVNLFTHDPALLLGQAYWSVTPVTRRNERTPGGLPIGFEEDSEYFGRLQRHLIQAVMAVPAQVRLIDEMEAFRYVTLLFLLRSESLRLISIWNPTFLILLLERLAGWWSQLAADIAQGSLSPPTPLAPELHTHFEALNRPGPDRAAAIRATFETGSDPGITHTRLWPQLQLISCWTEANAARYVPDLARLLPQVRIQGKGLIATEGIVSFPLAEFSGGAALAIRSHFFEFIPTTQPSVTPDHHSPRLAHELETSGQYAVVLTTGGGLYRYRLNDLVEVVGHLGTCPLLRFVGKEVYISDWFGEKLNERHVRQALDKLLSRQGIPARFAMLACEEEEGRHAYTLFIEANGVLDETLLRLGQALEIELRDNYHYRYCRDLGQLEALRVFRIDGGALDTYLAACQSHGQRAGDIKPIALHRLGGWAAAFRGRMIG
ncbi:MAG TPA: GH3 auxin-responsive promoter family protein [Anaerolineae bacterium]